jgi:iron complex outermembrane receptor protein
MTTVQTTTTSRTLALIIATVLAGAAQAQEQPTLGDTSVSGVEEIVVTATRREERLQDVPLAVSAISGDQLAEAGFKNLTDIQYQMAGVQFGVSPNDAGFRLRGVGTAGGFTSSSEQNVGTVVDGVVIPFGNPVASLGDVERVEVLKGPQGTQFGKNASSGVVSITTRRPTTDEFGGSAFASYAELNDRDIHAGINVPLGDTTAMSLFAFDREHDGFIDNVVRNEEWGGSHAYGGRAKLLWQPSDTFNAYLIADWSKEEHDGPGQLWTLQRLPDLANPLMAARFGPVLALGIQPGDENAKSAEEYPGFGGAENYGASLELNWTLGDYTLTSVTAYRKLDEARSVFAIDAIDLPIFTAQELKGSSDRDFVSEELRLTSPSGNTLEYVAGVYYSRLRTGLDNETCAQLRPALPFDPVIINITAGCTTTSTESTSLAAFGDGSIRLGERTRLLGGVRLTRDEVNAESFSVIDPNYPPGPSSVGFVVPYEPRPLAKGSTSKSDWSGRLGLEFRANDDVMWYGTVARGYLGPTVTFSGLTGEQVDVEPQTVDDVTLGIKSQWLDRRLTLNANVFYDKYKDLQTSIFNGLEFLTENAGGFEAKGFEVETTFALTDQFSVNASYTYSDTEFTDYITQCPNSIQAQGAAAIAEQCNAPGSAPGTPLFQAEGYPLPGAPKHTATLGADFRHPIGTLLLDASANYYYRSETQYDAANSYSVQDAYGTLGASIGLGADSGAWRAAVFVRNALDERFHAAIIGLPFADPGGEVNWNTRDGRRTVGVSLDVKF